MTETIVEIFTDGACSGNPGPGGWACIIRTGDEEKVLTGGSKDTTNQRMELMPAIAGLSHLDSPCKVKVYSDSECLVKGMREWIEGWKSRGWKNASNKPVKNRDQWELLDPLASQHQVEWMWVRGHADHPENKRLHRLAVEAIERYR